MMYGRLFWKILLGLWFTFIFISQLMWVGFSFYGDRRDPPEVQVEKHVGTLQIALATQALQQGGLPRLKAVVATWPESERRYLKVFTKDFPTPIDFIIDKHSEPDSFWDRFRSSHRNTLTQVTGPNGEHYQLYFDTKIWRKEFLPGLPEVQQFLHLPAPMVWIGVLGGLIFSWMLAWNLTRPLSQLRAGFGRVAQGDLSVRLLPVMRRRHDEISDVARDFDSMSERLEVLVSAREQLLHDVSHELRSPLARLQLAIGLVRQNEGNLENSLHRIEREAERMDKMIGELLTLSRTENTAANEEYFDLLGLVTAVVNDARYEAQVPGIEITLSTSGFDDYTVTGVSELIRRAIDNILRNALRFSSPGQLVSVTLGRDEQEWIIGVADQGPGVEKSKLSSIFDPFIRIDSPLSGKGYGLGLAIARKAIQAHGGKIEAENRGQGGLLVRVCIPRWK
ncbi:ATP-binding protein [Prodigiosinella aquatilis]|nr:ATP-binding protein [Prodigiosinella sp. LS101]WJV54704.1 ATP-binding protein [Prodigiosinella sp. LS101]WJV59067.1 ATP-binding protein [Pectobacteriaceae bacterium C111]